MNGLQTAHAPSSKIVIPHFLAGGIAFIFVSVLLAISTPELLTSYYHNKLVAVTHIAVLGWASMMVLGALYQLIPVVYETSLFSEKLARFTFWMFSVSIVALSYAFWTNSYTELLFYASLLMFTSLLLFIINLHFTYRKATKSNIQSKFITTGIYWLAATELLGTSIALNFKYNFLSEAHLHYLKIHAHLGLVGWFLLLITGAASILIPMFMISHNLNMKKLDYAYYTINAGLLVLTGNWFFSQTFIITLSGWLSISVGIGFFFSFVGEAYRTRLRKKLDVGLKYTIIAMAVLVLPVIIALFLLITGSTSGFFNTLVSGYGFSIIFGIISMLIFGQTYKTLPFIVWLDRYQIFVGKKKTPLPRQLYSEKLANLQFYLYLPAAGMIFTGFFIQKEIILSLGTGLLVLVSILNFTNILKIVFHKTTLEEL